MIIFRFWLFAYPLSTTLKSSSDMPCAPCLTNLFFNLEAISLVSYLAKSYSINEAQANCCFSVRPSMPPSSSHLPLPLNSSAYMTTVFDSLCHCDKIHHGNKLRGDSFDSVFHGLLHPLGQGRHGGRDGPVYGSRRQLKYTITDLKSLHVPELDLTRPKVYNPPNSVTSSGDQMFKYKKGKLKPYHCH